MAELSESERLRLSASGRPRDFADGERLIKQGELDTTVYVIESGYVLVLDGTELTPVVLALRRRGDVVGEIAGWMNQPRSASVRAVGPVHAREYSFERFCGGNGHSSAPVLRAMSRMFVRKLGGTDRLLRDARLPAPTAMARALHELAERYGTDSLRGRRILVPLEQTDLGALIGYSVKSVERVLHQMHDRGVLASRRPLVVRDMAALRALARLPEPEVQ